MVVSYRPRPTPESGTILNTASQPPTATSQLALTDELERVRLELELARWTVVIEGLQSEVAAEEESQQSLKLEIEQRLGNLQRDVESLSAIVSRLEFRLQRLNVAHKPLSDTELDDEEQSDRKSVV